MIFKLRADIRFGWLFTLVLLLSLSLRTTPTWADPPPHQEWARLFGTLNDDWPTSVAVSRSGQIYAVGYTVPPGCGRNNFISKINNHAVPEWFQQWDGNYVGGVAVDESEFVSLASTDGPPNQRAQVRRLDRCGKCYWNVGFPDLGTINSGGNDAGSVATLCGQTYVAVNSDAGVHLVKLNPAGGRCWVTTLNRKDGFSSFTEIKVDRAGNAYVAGQSLKSSSGQPAPGLNDNFVAKFDVNGVELWRRIWGTANQDQPVDLILNSPGDVIVGTRAINASGGQTNSLAVFDATGNLRSDTTVDFSDIGGTTFDRFGRLYRNETYSVSRYSLDSTTATWTKDIWQWKLPAGPPVRQQIRHVASDPLGNIYLTGYTDREFFGQPRIGGLDGFVVKLVPVP